MDTRRTLTNHASTSLLLLVAALLIAVVVWVLTDVRGEAGAAPAAVENATGPAANPTVGPTLDPVHASPPAFEAIERERIARHLAEVESELRTLPVGHLDADRRRNRARHIEVLAEYRERGVFPRNLHFPGELVPYFVDDRGVHCAVGYLIHRDGRDDIVHRIAAERNNATIAELADDAELLAWLDEAGLTPAEAARIQPMYCAPGTECCGMYPCPVTEPAPDVKGGVTGSYAAASLASAAVGGVAIGLNLAWDRGAGERGSASRWLGGVGATAGLAGLGLGVHGLAEGGDARAVGGVNVALGLLGTWVGMRSLVRGPVPATARPPFEDDEEDREGDSSPAAASRVTVSPILPLVGGGGRTGLAVRVRH
jgi:hypothetical protein